MKTIDELVAAVEILQALVAAQDLAIANQAIEITRLGDMVQTLSESHDLNRRELQAATKAARDFTNEMDEHVTQARALRQELAAENALSRK
ncbi:MAG: hypothetical protein ABR498_03585 [Candidatus Dormibacteria bacterium]